MGSKQFFIYAVIIHVFAGILCTAFYWLIPATSVSPFIGTSIFIDALLLQIFLTDRNSNILLGFILPINVGVIIGLFLALQVFSAINGQGNNLYLMVSALFVAYAYHEWKNRSSGPRGGNKKPHLKIHH